MQNLKLSASSDSLSAIFKDYQIKALATIPNAGFPPIGTKSIWMIINESEDMSISRASVINFLDYLREHDLVMGHLATGKGGKRFNYTFQIDRQFFNTQVSTMLLGAIIEEYPDVDMFKIVRLVNGHS